MQLTSLLSSTRGSGFGASASSSPPSASNNGSDPSAAFDRLRQALKAAKVGSRARGGVVCSCERGGAGSERASVVPVPMAGWGVNTPSVVYDDAFPCVASCVLEGVGYA